MRLLITCFLLVFQSSILQSQTIKNSEFTWDKETNQCISSRTGNVVYLVPKYHPEITHLSKKSFAKKLKEAINDMNFNRSIEGVIKLLVQFEKPFPLTLDRIGTKGLLINNKQKACFRKLIESVKNYNLGSSIGVKQSTVGIINIDIKNGQLAKIKYGSIKFAN